MNLQSEDEADELAWPDQDSSDAPEEMVLAEPDPEPEPEPEPEPTPDDDLERLRQKVKSAEGRYTRFGEDIESMRRELAKKEGREPEISDTPVLPEGWTQADWEDFATDSPTEAELLQASAREQNRLRQRVDDFYRQNVEQESRNAFRQRVLDAHPDYEPLMAKEGQQFKLFVDQQRNPLLRKAYQQAYQKGTADEVVELVNQYKLSRRGSDMDRRINDSLAVTSRSSVPDSSSYGGLPDANDEDGAWEYFDDEKI